ncbi:unnamed protein product [Arctia plantaginis]|uniref:Endonuclease/exonuclease/phosphatase domain-containing protein n=1 Tax=Arctia plantaginis TaxID=874455 RepID=A0A8S0YZG3_ARCPL|nr:unnamed protein product [Arctia plantaginis]
MSKCKGCGKYIAQKDITKCSKCQNYYHRTCALVATPGVKSVSPKWICAGCNVVLATPPAVAEACVSSQPSNSHGATASNNLPKDCNPAQTVDVSLILKEIRIFREEINALISELREFREEMLSLQADNKMCNDRVDLLEKRVGALEEKSDQHLYPDLTTLETTVRDLKLKLNEREQESLLNDIEVSGDVVYAKRAGNGRRNYEESEEKAPRPRVIVVRLTRRETREELLHSARVRRGLTTKDIQLAGTPRRVYINERLTQVNRKLFHKAREAAMHHNYRHEELMEVVERHKIDFISINETWLREGEEGKAPALPGYLLKHIPRSATVKRGRGGGIGFYIKREVTARRHSHPVDSLHSSVEQMWFTTSVNGIKLAIGTAYRPPWLDVDLFLDALTFSVNSLGHCDGMVLMGDFNINMLNESDAKTDKLKTFLSYISLKQIIDTPTHFTPCLLAILLCSIL